MMNEELNLVMSGARDCKTITYNLETGDVRKVFELGIGIPTFLYNLGTIVLVGGYMTFRLIDQKKLEQIDVDWLEMEFECKFPFDMKLIPKKEKSFVYLGGLESNKISKVMLPEVVSKMSKKSCFILLTNSSNE
jgi:hypothetical protein